MGLWKFGKGVIYVKFVMPIMDKRIITDIAGYLEHKNERDYVLFLSGIYLGRRISDILQYRVRDLRDKDYIEIPEQKTGDVVRLSINPKLQKIYKHYLSDKPDYEYVFRCSGIGNKPISRVRAWQILNDAAVAVGYRDHIGCHSLRKTFAYWLYKESDGDISMVQELLGHDDPAVTRRYIGIDQQKKDAAINGLDFG